MIRSPGAFLGSEALFSLNSQQQKFCPINLYLGQNKGKFWESQRLGQKKLPTNSLTTVINFLPTLVEKTR